MTYYIEIHSKEQPDTYVAVYKDANDSTICKTISTDQAHKILKKRQRGMLAEGKFQFMITEPHFKLLVSY